MLGGFGLGKIIKRLARHCLRFLRRAQGLCQRIYNLKKKSDKKGGMEEKKEVLPTVEEEPDDFE